MSWLGGPVSSGGDGGDQSKAKEDDIDPQRYLQPSAPYVFGANGGAPQLRVKLEPILLEFEEYTATHRLAFNMCALRPVSRLCAFARARALAAAALTRADRWRCRARPRRVRSSPCVSFASSRYEQREHIDSLLQVLPLFKKAMSQRGYEKGKPLADADNPDADDEEKISSMYGAKKHKYTDAELKWIFDEIDINNSGNISAPELAKVHYSSSKARRATTVTTVQSSVVVSRRDARGCG